MVAKTALPVAAVTVAVVASSPKVEAQLAAPNCAHVINPLKVCLVDVEIAEGKLRAFKVIPDAYTS